MHIEYKKPETFASCIASIPAFVLSVTRERRPKKQRSYFGFCPACSFKGLKLKKRIRKGSVFICPTCGEAHKLNQRPLIYEEAMEHLWCYGEFPHWHYQSMSQLEDKSCLIGNQWTIHLHVDSLHRFAYLSVQSKSLLFSFHHETHHLFFGYQHGDKKLFKNVSYGGLLPSGESIESALSQQGERDLPSLAIPYFRSIQQTLELPTWMDRKVYSVFEQLALSNYPGLACLPRQMNPIRCLRTASVANKKRLRNTQSRTHFFEAVHPVSVFKSEFARMDQLTDIALEHYLFLRIFFPNAHWRIRLLLSLIEFQNVPHPQNDEDLFMCDMEPLFPPFLNYRSKKHTNPVLDFFRVMARLGLQEEAEELLGQSLVRELTRIQHIYCWEWLFTLRDVERILNEFISLWEGSFRTCCQSVQQRVNEAKGSLIRLEQLLSEDVLQLQITHQDDSCLLTYEKEEHLLYERKVHGFTFELATSALQLQAIGNTLCICVGSSPYYFNAAKEKSIFLIFMRDQFTDVTVVLEFTKKRRLVQAKGKYNNHNYPLSKDTVVAIIDYCEQVGIDYRACGDIPATNKSKVS